MIVWGKPTGKREEIEIVDLLAFFNLRKVKRNFYRKHVKGKMTWETFNRVITKKHKELYG